MSEDNVVIDESNFNQYFREIKNTTPEKDEILVAYRATASLIAGDLKREIISLLIENDEGANIAVNKMQKFAHASEREAIKVVKNICEDIYLGMREEQVLMKDYLFILERFFYTKKQYVPVNDPHWEVIKILHAADDLVSIKLKDTNGNE